MTTQRLGLMRKAKTIDELASLLKQFRTIVIVGTERLRAGLLNDMRLIFKGVVLFKYVKPNLWRKAAEKVGDPALVNFARRHSSGSMMLALTNEDPFKIAHEFRLNAVELKAKAGDVAQTDIIVEPMNTGLPPGPVIAELNEAGLPTRIETGSVWITKRTVVAKAGEAISPRKAAALSKIGIKPIRLYLVPKAALFDGIEIEESLLKIEPPQIYNWLKEARQGAFILSLKLSYFTSENVPSLISRAAMEACMLAFAIQYPMKDIMEILLMEAELRARALALSLST